MPATPDYAPRVPWQQRRGVHRVLQGAILLAAAVGVFFLLPWMVARIRCAHWVSRCEAFALAPGTVVYETEPARARSLLAADRQYRRIGPGYDAHPRDDLASFLPACWEAMGPLLDPHGSPPYFRQFPPILFCHARTSADGQHRLVVLQYDGHRSYLGRSDPAVYAFNVTLLTPALLRAAKPETRLIEIDPVAPREPECITRFFAGQPDAADASRFSVEYDTAGTHGTLHFQLSARGDRVTVSP